ncbi:response regulator [Natronoglomus mannanivorans]|uniref:Response regulator n=1 Tax=Natronoglomus mannanivorans TaxID=2979990 RepID=A0AAP3E434_9EURY|nr:response regulator [Halobacteria archaeon AArc-xg1-1]
MTADVDTDAGGDGPDTVLIVEDNPGDLRLIEEAFRAARLETTLHAVSTGEAALDFVYRRGEYVDAPEPDVILLDWNLPKMDGEDVLCELEDGLAQIPVVVMTGAHAKETIAESETDRIDTYLTKPSDPTEYVDAIHSVY